MSENYKDDKEKEIKTEEAVEAVVDGDVADNASVVDETVVVEQEVIIDEQPAEQSSAEVVDQSADAVVEEQAVEDVVDATAETNTEVDIVEDIDLKPIREPEQEIIVESNVEVISQPEDDGASDIPTVEVISSSKRKITSNKSISKKKKGLIAIAIAVVAVAIILSIVLPVVFYRAPRIFVKSGDGFTSGGNAGSMDKYFYVLSKNVESEDITISGNDVYSIDFNKHTLKVNGDFTISSEREGTLYIGTRESKTEYSSKKAHLEATNIIINTPNLNVVLMADVSCENLEINAKSVQLGNFLSRTDMSLQAESVRLSGDIVGSTTSEIIITACPNVVVDSNVTIESSLNLIDSSLTVEKDGTLDTVVLDDTSKATVKGNITLAIIGGAQVTMEEGHTCQTYQDINTLVIFRDTQKSHVIKNCKNIIYVEKLAQPTDINIEEHNSKIICNVAKVNFASGYRFMLNGEVVGETKGEGNTKLDITDYVKEIGTYTVSVMPLGNFTSETDLTNQGHKTMYVDGEESSIQYNCVMTLQAPQGLQISDDYVLTFAEVPHADFYIITVDGVMVVRSDISSNTADLTRYLSSMGNHSVRVQAFSVNENIQNSSVSMVSYSTTEKLEAIDSEQLKATFSSDFTAINVSWHGVANGYDYVVYLEVNGDRANRLELGRSSDVDEIGAIIFTVTLDEIGIVYDQDSDDYFDIIVVAAEHDYYTRSDETTCRVKVQDTVSVK
ncbi:MAG: hypothetical protein K2G37_03365 [Clostridia bacterium]|nr:hypothetical protein [Clostridia bacterium]MDE7328219.1 hypothetical protein [Clostridia bacterium]